MARAFRDILADLSRGVTHDEMTDRLAEVVQAVTHTGKAGSITLQLSIKPNGDDAVVITDKITAKIPEGVRGNSLFFATADGDLVRTDPKQVDLPLRTVEARGA